MFLGGVECGFADHRLVLRPLDLEYDQDRVADELQDLADSIANIRQAAVGFDLKFRLRLELSGVSRPPDDVVTKINLLLQDISAQLRLR
jgi:hypothetical protein